jgi:DegV family protein with EDD domain
MARIAVVTDSVACLPPELVEAYGIRIVPVRIILGERIFRDGIDVTAEEVYAWQRAGIMPTSSQPSVGDFLETYRELARQAEGIVSIHVSAAMTGTYNAALLAAQMVPEVPIRVIDSQAATMAQGFLVLEAARAAERGASLDEIVARVEALRPRLRFFAVLETVTYLIRSGRAPALAALAVDVLQIKPILTMQNGRIEVLSKVRTRRRAIEEMVERMARDVGERPVHAAVFHAAALEEAEALRQQILARFDCRECYLTTFSPVMGLYAGPGVLGLAYYTEEDR